MRSRPLDSKIGSAEWHSEHPIPRIRGLHGIPPASFQKLGREFAAQRGQFSELGALDGNLWDHFPKMGPGISRARGPFFEIGGPGWQTLGPIPGNGPPAGQTVEPIWRIGSTEWA